MAENPTERSLLGIRKVARVAFVSAFLVVLAGSIVRMTGSGMGCPDWPQCFGLTIPPTSETQVRWQPDEDYSSGRMILEKDSLWSTPTDHLSGTSFEADRATGLWTHYTRHDYATFNPFHTWVEFINRLLGAFAGLPALILVALTLLLGIKHGQWRPLVPAVGALFALAFVAWLGKKVVDGNLIPGSITLAHDGRTGHTRTSMAGSSRFVWPGPKPQNSIAFSKSVGWLWPSSSPWPNWSLVRKFARAVDQLVHDGVQRSEMARQSACMVDRPPHGILGMVLAVHGAALWPGLQLWPAHTLGMDRDPSPVRPICHWIGIWLARHARRSPAHSLDVGRWAGPHGRLAARCKATSVKPMVKAHWATM